MYVKYICNIYIIHIYAGLSNKTSLVQYPDILSLMLLTISKCTYTSYTFFLKEKLQNKDNLTKYSKQKFKSFSNSYPCCLLYF